MQKGKVETWDEDSHLEARREAGTEPPSPPSGETSLGDTDLRF